MANKQITMNNLPEYSPWPARLLGLEPWEIRKKTSEAVTREYNVEKWGALLKQIQTSNFAPSLDNVNNLVFKDIGVSLCYDSGNIILKSAELNYEKYINIIKKELQAAKSAGGIVELGAGYGAIILNLAKHNIFQGKTITAGEYTKTGRELIKIISKHENIVANVYSCDLSKEVMIDGHISERSIIFTSYAACYVPIMTDQFVDSLIATNPNLIIHFEPCYAHYDERTLLGLMCKRYIELNDYNKNLATILHQNEEKGKIKIVKEKQVVIGNNPFLPISIIAWKPI